MLRRAASEYLERKRRAEVDAQYRRAYADGSGLGDLAIATGCED